MAKKDEVKSYTADELQFEDEPIAADALQFADSGSEDSGVTERLAEREELQIPQTGGEAIRQVMEKTPGMVGEVLESPIPGVGGVLGKAKSNLESSSEEAAKYYSDLGVPTLGKATEMGGKFLAGSIPVTMKDALFIAAAGPALKLAGMVGKPVVKAGGNFIADIAGAIAGKSPEAVKVMYKKPGAIWKKATELFGQEHQKRVVDAIDEGRRKGGEQFRAIEEALTGFAGSPSKANKVKLGPVLKDTVSELERRGHHVPQSISGKTPIKMGRFPGDSTEARELYKMLDTLKKNPELDFGEALNLRRQIDDMIDYGIEGSQGLRPVSGESNAILKSIRHKLNVVMKRSVPHDIRKEWEKANSAYRASSSAYAELRKQVVGATPRNTERKLLQMLQEGRYDDEVISRAEKLGEKAAKELDDIRDHLAAKEFQRWASGGIRGAFGFLPTSPRAVGIGASAAGAAGNVAGALGGAVATNPRTSAMGAMGLRNLLNENQ